ncbi:MAG: trypsin-like peptidase domain-containing protein [Planctomycetaceae bacterium]
MSLSEEEYENAGRTPRLVNGWLVGTLVVLAAALMYETFRSREPVFVNHSPRVVTPRGELGADERSTIEVFEHASPSVVFIRTKGYQPSFPRGVIEQELSSGTGFVWDENGHIVTNLHVVRDVLERGKNASLEVQFSDGRVVDADVIGGVFEYDIAVLKVPGGVSELVPITIGSSQDLQVGQKVLAIGNPFGFDQTLSTGVIGGLNRIVATERQNEFLSGLIQTDAAINPGNSGGPLLDSAGRLIGVNTAIVSPTGAYSGLGFAVPVDAVLDSVPRVVEEASGKQRPELLGASVLNRESALQLGIPQEIIDRGLIVGRVLHNSAAFDAGLMPGDQITAVDGKVLSSGTELRQLVESHEPGDVIELTIIRREQSGRLLVPLRARKLFF